VKTTKTRTAKADPKTNDRWRLIAGFSRKLLRFKEPTAEERDAAVLHYLISKPPYLRVKKKENDFKDFIGYSFIKWAEDEKKKKALLSMEDRDLVIEIDQSFRDYLNAREEAERPGKGQPWRAGRMPADAEGHELPEGGRISYTPYEKTILELKRPGREERAFVKRQDKEDEKMYRRLKSKPHLSWILPYFHQRLKEAVERQHYPELEREHRRRAGEAISKAIREGKKKA